MYKNYDRTQIFCSLILKTLLEVCLADEAIFEYVLSMPAPCLKFSRYIDFFGLFIQKFVEDANKTTYTQQNYPKAELGKSTSELYEKFVEKIKLREGVSPSPSREISKEEKRPASPTK